MPTNPYLKAAFAVGMAVIALYLFGYVPILGSIGYLLVPTAILLCLGLLVGGTLGRGSRSPAHWTPTNL